MDIKDLYDLLEKYEANNREDHKIIITKLDGFSKRYTPRWAFILIIPVILGSYGFAWAYGKWIVEIILKHIGG